MASLVRDVERFSGEPFDLVVIGGGIYGIMLSLEAGFRGKRALLLEQNDFGSATSWNHLRTLHGGLRYLQTLDLPRFFESVRERQWFFVHFPRLIKVLPCLMPLYDKGVRRKSFLKIALNLNDSLSFSRNNDVIPEKHLGKGKILSPGAVRVLFPVIDASGMTGGALWHDGMIMEPERLLMELILWSCAMGGCFLNYVRANQLIVTKNRVEGVRATDSRSGAEKVFRAPLVINAAGPWSRNLAEQFHRDFPPLFPAHLLLFNVLFDREALSEYSLAVSPQKGKGHTYFIHNWKNRMLVGTGETLADGMDKRGSPCEADVAAFLDDLGMAVPGLSLKKNEIEHVYHGLLPATPTGELTKREVILDHGRMGGPQGFFSVSGVKFTTSHRVAQKTLDSVFPSARETQSWMKKPPEEANSLRATYPFDWIPDEKDDGWKAPLKRILEEESVVHVDDLIYRRTSLGENRKRLATLVPMIRDLFSFDEGEWEAELGRLGPDI